MRPRNLLNIIGLTKLGHYISSKQISCTSGTHAPTLYIFRVAPHQITHRTIMRHFLLAVYYFDFIKSIERRRKTSMNTENLVVNYCSKRKKIKYFCTISPNIHGSIFSEALVIEPVNLCDLSTFMIASYQGDPIRISYLKRQQK